MATYRGAANQVFNVKNFGAKGDGTTDDTTAINNAIIACNTSGGGIVWFPASTYKVTSPVKLYSGSSPTAVAFSNITLAGAGSNGTTGSIISQATTGDDVIQAFNDAHNSAQSTNLTIQDLCVTFGGTLTNSGNGIHFQQDEAGGPSFQQCNLENVVAQNMQGSGKYGFNFESMITSTVDTCMAVTCANGFYLNGSVGGAYDSVSTSVTFNNCYANMATNGVNGFNDVDNTYVSYVNCAVDIGANSTGAAYTANGSSSISYYACGCELDGTHSLTTGWLLEGGGSGIGLYDCYMFQSKTSIDVSVTGTTTGVHLFGFQDNSTISGSTGLKIASGSSVTECDSNWGAVGTPLNNSGTLVILNDTLGNMTMLGTNTSSGATASTPTFVSGTAKTLSTTNDVMLYMDITTAASLTIAIGPSSTPANTLQSSVTGAVGLESVRVPAGWYVKLTGTMADITFTQVTCQMNDEILDESSVNVLDELGNDVLDEGAAPYVAVKHPTQWRPGNGMGYVQNTGSLIIDTKAGLYIVNAAGLEVIQNPTQVVPKFPTVWTQTGSQSIISLDKQSFRGLFFIQEKHDSNSYHHHR